MSSRDLGKPDEICSCFLVKRNAEVPTPPRSPALARVTKFGLSSLLIGYFRRSPLVAVPTPLGRQSSDPPISTKTPKPCYLRLLTRPDSRPGSRAHGHDTTVSRRSRLFSFLDLSTCCSRLSAEHGIDSDGCYPGPKKEWSETGPNPGSSVAR